MAVTAEVVYADLILQQLQTRNAATSAFKPVFSDYQNLQRHCRELQVRCSQLDKEAGELRIENSTLHDTLQQARSEVVSNIQAVTAEAKAKRLQDDLNDALRDKARLAEDLMKAHRQLAVVRQTNEQQARELLEDGAKIKDQRARIDAVNEQLKSAQAAHTLASSELQSRMVDKEKAEGAAANMEKDLVDLTRRMLEMKEEHAEKMNEVNNMHQEVHRRERMLEERLAREAEAARQPPAAARMGGLPGGILGRMSSLTRGQAGDASSRRVSGEQVPAQQQQQPIAAARVPEAASRTFAAHTGGGFSIAFDRTGLRMASGGADRVVRMWDTVEGRQTGTLMGMTDTVTEVAFTGGDARALIAAGSDQALRMFNLETGRVRHTLTGHSAKVISVDCNPANEAAAVSCGADRCVKLWDLNRGFSSHMKVWPSTVNSLRYTLEGTLVASGHYDGTLRFWDFRMQRLANEVAGLHTTQICSVCVGRRSGLVLTCGRDNTLRLVDARSFQVQGTLSAPGFAVTTNWCTACLSPDESHVAAGSASGAVFVWEVESSRLVKTLTRERGTQSVQATAWSPEGAPVVSLDKAGNMTIWQ